MPVKSIKSKFVSQYFSLEKGLNESQTTPHVVWDLRSWFGIVPASF